MSRWILSVLLVLALAAPVAAQEPQAPMPRPLTYAALDSVSSSDSTQSNVQTIPGIIRGPAPTDRPPMTLNALCASFAALQVADIATTYRALGNGAREANPVMGGFTSNKAAFIGFKAATTVGTIYLARKIGVKNRVASTVLMAAVNSAYAIIVAHNYRVGSSVAR
jgi:hypothetical protein